MLYLTYDDVNKRSNHVINQLFDIYVHLLEDFRLSPIHPINVIHKC